METQTQTLPTTKQLKRALVLREQILAINEKLHEKQKELAECLSHSISNAEATEVPIKVRKTRVMSEEGRRKIAEAQKTRWAKIRDEQDVNKDNVNDKEVKRNNKK